MRGDVTLQVRVGGAERDLPALQRENLISPNRWAFSRRHVCALSTLLPSAGSGEGSKIFDPRRHALGAGQKERPKYPEKSLPDNNS